MRDVQIRAMQLFWLLLVPRIAPAICFTPTLTATRAPQCWRSNVPATIFGLGLALLYLALARRFPRQSLIEYCPRVLGRWPGKVVGLGYIWFFLHVAAMDSRVFAEIFSSAVLTETPLMAILLLAVVVIAAAVRSGVEVLGRLGELLMPVVVVTLMLLLLLIVPDLKPTNLLPLSEGSLRSVLLAALTPTTLMGETVALTMLYPLLRDQKHAGRAALGAAAGSGLLALFSSAAVVALFGDERSHLLTFPFLELVRNIQVAEIIQRLESLVITVWVVIWFLKTGLFLLLAAMGLAQWLDLSDHRGLVSPLAAWVAIIAISQSTTQLQFVSFFRPDVYFPYAGIFTIALPALLLVLSGRAAARSA